MSIAASGKLGAAYSTWAIIMLPAALGQQQSGTEKTVEFSYSQWFIRCPVNDAIFPHNKTAEALSR